MPGAARHLSDGSQPDEGDSGPDKTYERYHMVPPHAMRAARYSTASSRRTGSSDSMKYSISRSNSSSDCKR